MCAAIGPIILPTNTLSYTEQEKEKKTLNRLVDTLASFYEPVERHRTTPMSAREVVVLSGRHLWAVKDLTRLKMEGASSMLASHTVQYITEDDELLSKVKNLMKNARGDMTKGAILFLYGAPGEDGLVTRLSTELDRSQEEVNIYLRNLFS